MYFISFCAGVNLGSFTTNCEMLGNDRRLPLYTESRLTWLHGELKNFNGEYTWRGWCTTDGPFVIFGSCKIIV